MDELQSIDREIERLKQSIRTDPSQIKEDRASVLGLADLYAERKMIVADRTLPKDVAANWIRDNYKPNDRIAITMIGPGGHTIQRLDKAERFAKDDYQQWLREQNGLGYNIHVSMNSFRNDATRRTKENVENIRHVYLDLDHGGREALRKVIEARDLPPVHSVIESSPDKFQVHWRTEGFTVPQAERLMRALAREYGADPAATDASRVMRLPGFLNRKEAYRDDPPLVKIERGVSKHEYPATPRDFPARYDREIERPRQLATEEARERGPVPQKGGPDHSRSGQDWRWVMQSLEKGMTPGEIQRILEGQRKDKPDPAGYAERTVERAMKHYEQQHNHDRQQGSQRGDRE